MSAHRYYDWDRDEETTVNMNHPTTDVAEPTLENNLVEARDSENVIIGLTAKPCSGKSTVVDLMNVLGVQSTCMGDVVREAALMSDSSQSDGQHCCTESQQREDSDTEIGEDPWETAQQLRDQRLDEIARRTSYRVTEVLEEDGLVVVDGLRSPEERRYYETEFDATFVLLDVFCDDTTRIERYANDYDIKWVEAVRRVAERDHRELDVGLGELLDSSQSTIYNDWDTSHTELMSQTERLVNDVKEQ